MKPRIFLSKTSYIKGLQCQKALYLYKHHYNLKDPLSPERRMRFDIGHRAGIKARELYPGGTDASPRSVHLYHESLELTSELLKKGKHVIYEAAFEHFGVLVYADILAKGQNGWRLLEVKSSEKISETYVEDLKLQFHIIRSSGLTVEQAAIIHLNHPLDEINWDDEAGSIFRTTDFTEECENNSEITENRIREMLKIIASPGIPAIQMGEQCMKPYPCDFRGFCSTNNSNPAGGLFGT